MLSMIYSLLAIIAGPHERIRFVCLYALKNIYRHLHRFNDNTIFDR